MSMISRDERKQQKGLKKLINSFSYPIKGLKYAYRNEQNLAVDVGIALFVILAGITSQHTCHRLRKQLTQFKFVSLHNLIFRTPVK